MRRFNRLLLTFTIALPIILLIQHFTGEKEDRFIALEESAVSSFLEERVGTGEGEAFHMDDFFQLGDSGRYITTFHIDTKDKTQVGYAIFTEEKEDRLDYRTSDFGSTSEAVTVLETKKAAYAFLYGMNNDNNITWKTATVTFKEDKETITFENPEEPFYHLVKELPSSIDDPQKYIIEYSQ